MLDLRSSFIAPFTAIALAALAAACTKTESTSSSSSGTSPSASTTTTTPATASATPSATVSATPSATADSTASAATTGTAVSVTGKSDGGHAAPTASASAAPVECGTKPQPDCPLQGWMKANANPPMLGNDLPGLASALDKIAGFAPPGYTNWASISKDGANAARGGDMTATKASCRTCHDQYKDKYKKEMRARKI